jgi:hypothetical protein
LILDEPIGNNDNLDVINEEVKDDASESDDDESDSDEDSQKYPDTHIKVEHDTGKIIMRSNVRTTSCQSEEIEKDDESNEHVFYLGDDKPITFPALPTKSQKVKKPIKNEPKESKQQKPKEKVEKPIANVVKRGQHGKLKKIKEKYKDQDEEDKALVMGLLKVLLYFYDYFKKLTS